jgi:hypothetical protein
MWTYFILFTIGTAERFCVHGNETSGFVTANYFIKWPNISLSEGLCPMERISHSCTCLKEMRKTTKYWQVASLRADWKTQFLCFVRILWTDMYLFATTGRSYRRDKSVRTWSWPLTSIKFRGFECVQFHIHALYTPLWSVWWKSRETPARIVDLQPLSELGNSPPCKCNQWEIFGSKQERFCKLHRG